MLIYLYSSDAKSQDEFKGNVISNFTIRLPQSIYLNGEWEMALLEAHIPLSWPRKHKVSHYGYSFRIAFFKGELYDEGEDVSGGHSKLHKIVLTDGIDKISSVESLMGVLNRKNLGVHFSRDEDNRIKITLNRKHFKDKISPTSKIRYQQFEMESIELSYELSQVLGFDYQEFTPLEDEKNGYVSDHHPFLPNELSSINVHCDLIKSQFVSSSYQKLLRILPIAHYTNETLKDYAFDNPLYVSIEKHHFSTINFQLLDNDQQSIRFEKGEVMICLDLRPIKNISN